MSANDDRSPIVVTHESGVRFAAQIRAHRLIVDQPERAGGQDSGPTPLEVLGASLGSCVALYVTKFCQARGIALDGMRVEVEQHQVPNPNRIDQFIVRVVLPVGVPEHYRPMLEAAARVCPAHNTLAHGAAVAITIETTAVVG